jgi:hypothetical protein
MSNKVAITKMNGITLIKKKNIIINCYVDISISKKWYLGPSVEIATVYASNSSVIATYKITIDYGFVIKGANKRVKIFFCDHACVTDGTQQSIGPSSKPWKRSVDSDPSKPKTKLPSVRSAITDPEGPGVDGVLTKPLP